MDPFEQHKNSFETLFKLIHLGCGDSADKLAKRQQIISYLQALNVQARKYSKNQTLRLVDCAAGNCYLSFLAYHYFAYVCGRPVEIHCLDINGSLMKNSKILAIKLGFDGMHFHTGDILDFQIDKRIDILYTLHGCGTATDKALFLGIRLQARSIFTVTCCQHYLHRQSTGGPLKGISRYNGLKTKMLYYIADAMRAHLVGLQGYEVDVFDFTSSRNTDKNVMLRARRNRQIPLNQLKEEYSMLREYYCLKPFLEELLSARYH
ncbi:MAG: methyltransferase [Spirochaetales bacterium]|nr:methyltransferase [Spirochaetales bacterium]